MNIHDAAKCGDVERIRSLLIDKPERVFDRKQSWTPLHWAAFSGQKDAAGLLLQNKATVDATDNNDQTPLLLASWKGHTAVAELLLTKGAAVNVKSANGVTPLHIAAGGGFRDAAELLIAKGADVNAKDNNGWTALDKAAFNKKADVVELLRHHGASAQERQGASAQSKNRLLGPVVGMICVAGFIVIEVISFGYWSSRGEVGSVPLWAFGFLALAGLFFRCARDIRSELRRRSTQRQLFDDATAQRSSTNI